MTPSRTTKEELMMMILVAVAGMIVGIFVYIFATRMLVPAKSATQLQWVTVARQTARMVDPEHSIICYGSTSTGAISCVYTGR